MNKEQTEDTILEEGGFVDGRTYSTDWEEEEEANVMSDLPPTKELNFEDT